MQIRSIRNIASLFIAVSRTRRSNFSPLSAKQLYFKFFKSHRTHVVSNCILSFLPGLFLVKAISKMEKKDSQKVIKEADNLYDDAKFEELYLTLDAHRDSDDPEILWRLARAIFEKCKTIQESSKKQSNYESALELVDKALEINENCWAAHKWRAILLDYVWQGRSTKGRIIHSYDIRKHMERAVELNPGDSTGYYLLGKWCYTFADMPWYQRQVAAAILASPPTSTYEEAFQYFEKAEKLRPLFYSMNLLMMGKCLLNLNEKDKAIVYLKQAIDYPIKTADDKEAHEEAEKILTGLNAL